MTGNVVSPKTLHIQLLAAGNKKTASRWNAILPKLVKNGCYRLSSWWDATQTWWTFEASWKYFPFMFAWVAAQIDPESTAGHAICDNSLGHHQNCLHNVRKLPYDHFLPGIHVTALTSRDGLFYSCSDKDDLFGENGFCAPPIDSHVHFFPLQICINMHSQSLGRNLVVF